ncbi:hypothetical protein K8Z49_29525 [Actinomadura madurae]|uniref:Uncharacterized protein n=1 Tax=Actinomadura madurae TaxID=1993 RepID=A0A1I5X3P2_9ACTN|nr:hypothetical protein [Actinomadura madurae]SFQ26481.1 hypothetical protein SAMN04489713_125100 [Actinomadura madurae]SPT60784.1 Uncharacterised protein [Actinomadura madurae]
MTMNIAIRLALGGLLLVGAAACEGDDKSGAAGSSSAPSTAATTATPAPAQATPTTSAPGTPAPTTTKPKIKLPTSKQIVMIDPEGKKYTYLKMAQLAAGMRYTMGDRPQANFCEKSYVKGVEGGGKFPAGKAAFLAACHEGWRKAEQMHRAGQ